MPSATTPGSDRTPLAIVGASARAAAASAVRAGFQPVTADLFADLDLRRIATATRISPYPEGLLDWLRAIQPPAWMYTGALENHSELVDQMAWIAPLWGNPGDVLNEVRNPWQLSAALRDAGLLFPETRSSADDLPRDGSWLVKTCRGASGSGVQCLVGWAPPIIPAVYQRRITGIPCATVFVGNGETATLLGLTRQLVGESWLGAREFQYAGTIGLYAVAEATLTIVAQIGNLLADRFALQGLFGVDFIIDDHRVWTIEVNPRYTASVEIIERVTPITAIAAHAAGCNGDAVGVPVLNSANQCHGKAIVFAKRPLVVSQQFAEWAFEQSQMTPWPNVADVSPAHTQIAAGRPVITLFAAGSSADDVDHLLRMHVAEVENRLYAD